MNFAIDTTTLHPSTTLGLRALTALHATTACQKILDLGCGNGILSVASAHLWHARVVAADISENAVRDTKQAVEEYELADLVTVLRSDRFAHPQLKQQAPYDLIIANLLDQWLVEIAGEVKSCLQPGGHLILSGMLEWLAAPTKQAYQALGFEIQQELSISPWQACLFRYNP